MQTFEHNGVRVRLLTANDSFEELTELLHTAYARLASMGLRYWATHQSPQDTRNRCADGTTLIGESSDRIVATVTFYSCEETGGSPWLDLPDVASFGQFAVVPEFQGTGLGSRLMDECERLARESGAKHIALDTSERAEHLIRFYTKRGYEYVEHVQWESVNYRSVVMSKPVTQLRVSGVQ